MPPPATRPRIRRHPKDHAQRLRRAFQVAFLLLNAWIGVQFYLFVRYYETAGQSVRVARPAGVEGWLPIAALMNVKYTLLTGSLLEVHIDCGKCARACPSALPVDVLASVRSAQCTACMLCVSACPAAGALDLTARRRPLAGWALAVAIAAVFLGLTGYARLTGHWDTHLPDAVYFDLIPRANAFAHP